MNTASRCAVIRRTLASHPSSTVNTGLKGVRSHGGLNSINSDVTSSVAKSNHTSFVSELFAVTDQYTAPSTNLGEL
jgi:hypothetical protein